MNGLQPARVESIRSRFRTLHQSGTFLLPNAWDIGSAKLLVSCEEGDG